MSAERMSAAWAAIGIATVATAAATSGHGRHQGAQADARESGRKHEVPPDL